MAHLTNLVFDDVIMLRNYHLYWKDQEVMGGGRAAIYIHQNLPYTEVTIDSILEFIACKGKINSMYLVICSVYCSPDNVLIYDELCSSGLSATE